MAGKGNKNFGETINRGYFEYKMSKDMADAYLSARKGDEKKKRPQEYLCQIVNDTFGIKGTCVRVVIG